MPALNAANQATKDYIKSLAVQGISGEETNTQWVMPGDTAGLVSALSVAAANATATNPYTINCACFLYTISATLNIPSYTTIDLHGGILQGDAATAVSIARNAAWTSGNTNITIKNGTVDWNGTNRGSASGIENMGIRLTHSSFITLKNMRLLDADKYAVLFQNCDDVTADNIYFNTQSDGLHFSNGGKRHYINNLHGYCGDDLVAYTHRDWAAYEVDTLFDDFDDITIKSLKPVDTDNAVVKLIGGSPLRYSNTGITDNGDGTFTVAAAHTLVVGDVATLHGVTPSVLNGEHPVTAVVPGVSFTFAFSISGKHNGGNNTGTLTDLNQNWPVNGLVGMTVNNTTDLSSATITANTESNVTGTLSGGTQNDWDTGEAYTITVGNSSVHGTSGKQYYFGKVYIEDVQGSCIDIPFKLGEDNADVNKINFCHIKSLSIIAPTLDHTGARLVSIAAPDSCIIDNFNLDVRGKVNVTGSNWLLSGTNGHNCTIKSMTIQNMDVQGNGSTARVVNSDGIDFKNLYTVNVTVDNVESYFNQIAGQSYRAKLYFNNVEVTNSSRGIMLRDKLLVFCNGVYQDNNTSGFIYGFSAGAVVYVWGDITTGPNSDRDINVASSALQYVYGFGITTVQAQTTAAAGCCHNDHTAKRHYSHDGAGGWNVV